MSLAEIIERLTGYEPATEEERSLVAELLDLISLMEGIRG